MRCNEKLDTDVLTDYWLGTLAEAAEERVENHLLACDECGGRLRTLHELAEGIRAAARGGALRMVVSDSILDRATKEGLRVREYAPPPGGAVHCTVTAEDDLLVARLAADVAGAHRVDLSLCDETGTERLRMEDIPIAAGGEAILLQESVPFARALGSTTMTVRMVSRDEEGGERVLGEFTFHHTRTLPGGGV